jgi:hypothetical protein
MFSTEATAWLIHAVAISKYYQNKCLTMHAIDFRVEVMTILSITRPKFLKVKIADQWQGNLHKSQTGKSLPEQQSPQANLNVRKTWGGAYFNPSD